MRPQKRSHGVAGSLRERVFVFRVSFDLGVSVRRYQDRLRVLPAAVRYDITATVLFAFVISTADRFLPRTKAEVLDIAAGGLFIIGAFQGLLFFGEQFTTSAVAAIIVSTNPIIITGLSRVMLPDERLSRLGLLGLITGFLGVGIDTRPNPELLLSGELLGEILIFASITLFGIGTVLTRVVAADVHLPVQVREAWAMGIGAVVLHSSSFIIQEPFSAVSVTVPGVGALFYLALVPSVIGYMVFFELLDRFGPIEVNLVSYVSPVFAALIAWVLLGERLQFLTVVGFFVIFAGFVMIKSEEIAERVQRLT